MPALPIAPGDIFQVNQDNLLCLPARWTTILRFFVLNYAAHAVTIWSRPGEATVEKVFAMVLTFFFPVAGLSRGIDAIYRHASYHSNGGLLKGLIGSGSNEYEIHKAARAGALGIVIREQIGRHVKSREGASSSCFSLNGSDWDHATLCGILHDNKTPPGTRSSSQAFQMYVKGDYEVIKPEDLRWSREVSGLASQKMPSGYRVVELPKELAKHIILTPKKKAKLQISQSSNLVVAFIAVCQICYAAYELARVTGDQLERFGYSAFSLTVIPYLVMSFINLLGNLLTPTYPSVYIINTSTLKEARRRKNVFKGTIGYIDDRFLQDQHETPTETDRISEYAIKPYLCSQGKESPLQEFINEAIPVHHYENPRRNKPSLRICFDKYCQESHGGHLEVPCGAPSLSHSSIKETLFKFATLIIAIATHIAPIVYVGLNYGPPKSMDQKIVLPLWIATGDAFGLYLLYRRTSFSIVKQLWLWIRRRLLCGCGLTSKQRKTRLSLEPIVWLVCVVAGVVIGVWNFYIVAVQILAFGDCINVSSGM